MDSTTEFYIYDISKDLIRSENPLPRLQELWNLQGAQRNSIK